MVPFASISTPFALPRVPPSNWLSPYATKSGSNEGRDGVGDGVPATEPLVGVGEVVGEPVVAGVGEDVVAGVGDRVGEDVAVPQAARAAALAIIRAVRGIRIEWFLSCFGVCMQNDHPFVWVT